MALSMLGGEMPKVNPGFAGADKRQTHHRCCVQQDTFCSALAKLAIMGTGPTLS